MPNNFNDVFGKLISMDDETYGSFSNIISVDIFKEKREIYIVTEAVNIIEKNKLHKIEELIAGALKLQKCEIHLSYDKSLFTEKYLSELIEGLRERSVPVNGFFEKMTQ